MSAGNRILGWLLPFYMAWLEVSLFFFPYRYAERNPARRWCKRCGQREELYGLDFEKFVATGWEVMYPLATEPCKKHTRMLGDLDKL